MKQKYKIVVVDTGVDLSNKYIPNHQINGVHIQQDGTSNSGYQVETLNNNIFSIQDNIGHGTAVCGIILSHNPETKIFMVKLFDKDMLKADENLLYYAIKYVYENIDFEILNLSLGICILNNNKRMYELCEKIYEEKRIIVSAFDNNGSISYPAAFNNVIGVTSGSNCYNNDDFFIVKNELVNICAKGRQQRLIWLNNTLLMGSGNSYACAHLTGIISHKGVNQDIEKFLEKHCKGIYEFNERKKWKKGTNPAFQYQKVIVFPFNKEIHSLIRFQDLLLFDLIDVYDLKYSAKIGASTSNILKDKNGKDYIIRNINSIDWNSFDTFILGHTDEYFIILDIKEYKQKLIAQILDHNKYLYSFDDLSEFKIPENKRHLVFFPKVTIEDVPIAPFGKLYRQEKPVLGIFGTSSNQGKYTLQLKIRKELIKQDYKILQLGTEPSALLFGMDIIFPIGYNSTVLINRKDTVTYINRAMNCNSHDTDLIIVGSQSGTVIRDEGNLDNYNFNQIDFLYATQPDAVILCINVFDDINIISRTISLIEAAVGCKVISLVLFPFDYKNKNSSYLLLEPLSEGEFKNYKNKFEDKFHIPVYLLEPQNSMSELCNDIIKYFS